MMGFGASACAACFWAVVLVLSLASSTVGIPNAGPLTARDAESRGPCTQPGCKHWQAGLEFELPWGLPLQELERAFPRTPQQSRRLQATKSVLRLRDELYGRQPGLGQSRRQGKAVRKLQAPISEEHAWPGHIIPDRERRLGMAYQVGTPGASCMLMVRPTVQLVLSGTGSLLLCASCHQTGFLSMGPGLH